MNSFRNLGILLILASLALNGFLLWRAAQGPAAEVLRAQWEAERREAQAEQERLLVRHRTELETLTRQLDAEREERTKALETAQKTRQETRAQRLSQARKEEGKLTETAAKASGLKASAFRLEAGTLCLKTSDALVWMERSLKLTDDLELADAACAVKLAEAQRRLEPPLVEARQAAERAAQEATHSARRAEMERAAYQSELNRKQGREWLIGFGAAAGGLVVGALVGASVVWGR